MAFDFDGVDDDIVIGNILDPNADAFSVAIWVYANTWVGVDTANAIVVQQKDGTGTGRTWLAVNGDTGPTHVLNTGIAGAPSLNGATDIESRLGEWLHFGATTSSGGSGTVRIYLDGPEDGSATKDPEASNGDMILGKHKSPSTNNEEWDGRLAEFAVWNRELSAAEFLILQKYSPAFLPRGLLFYRSLIRNTTHGGFGSNTVTVFEAVAAVHDIGLIYPSSPQIITAPAAAGLTPPVGSALFTGQSGRMDLGITIPTEV